MTRVVEGGVVGWCGVLSWARGRVYGLQGRGFAELPLSVMPFRSGQQRAPMRKRCTKLPLTPTFLSPNCTHYGGEASGNYPGEHLAG
jgi:hypothetical protein